VELEASPTSDPTPVNDEDPITTTTDINTDITEPIPEEATSNPKTRSGRTIRTPRRFDDFIIYEAESNFIDHHNEYNNQHPIAMAASSDSDTLYYHEILREPDKAQFIQAMEEEIRGHNDNKNWVPVPRASVPSYLKVLHTVWAMRRKRRLSDGTIHKWKARIIVDGSKLVAGLDYWDTYAPVATWATIRTIMMMAAQQRWITKQLDFVQAYPQAPAQTEMYVEVSKGCSVLNHNNQQYVLKLINNIYGQLQTGKVWNDFLINGLTTKVGFQTEQERPQPTLEGQMYDNHIYR
jgi:Reverse transcriptase (RNA-dependent DNA polymerase)